MLQVRMSWCTNWVSLQLYVFFTTAPIVDDRFGKGTDDGLIVSEHIMVLPVIYVTDGISVHNAFQNMTTYREIHNEEVTIS